jgi:hypothetical protein
MRRWGVASPKEDPIMFQLDEPSVAITMANPTASAVRAANMTRHRDRSTRPNSSAPQEVRL